MSNNLKKSTKETLVVICGTLLLFAIVAVAVTVA
jgi:hypothetical protein